MQDLARFSGDTMSLYRPMVRSVVTSVELDDDFLKLVRVWFAHCPNPELIQKAAGRCCSGAVRGDAYLFVVGLQRFWRDASRSGRILAHSNPTRLYALTSPILPRGQRRVQASEMQIQRTHERGGLRLPTPPNTRRHTHHPAEASIEGRKVVEACFVSDNRDRIRRPP